jgi:hypothetical protein
MGGDSGDTEKVEFFKNPNERVIIARPDQFQDARSQPKTSSDAGSAGRPIAFSQVNHWNGNAPPSRDSLAAVRRATARLHGCPEGRQWSIISSCRTTSPSASRAGRAFTDKSVASNRQKRRMPNTTIAEHVYTWSQIDAPA